MPFELFIGLRYMKAKRKSTFISIITFISTAGVTLGVMALIVVLAVMTGFEDDLKEKILGTNAHIVVIRSGAPMEEYRSVIEKLKGFKGVQAATPLSTTRSCSHQVRMYPVLFCEASMSPPTDR